MATQWIEEVAVTCRASGTDYLDLIVDQAGLDFSVIPALNSLVDRVAVAVSRTS